MKTYARMVDGQPVEIIPPFAIEGVEVPIAERFTPAIVATLIEWPADQPLPEAGTPPPLVPTSVTMRQARLALLSAGHLDAVGAAIAALPSPQKEAAVIEWEYAATVDRSSAFMASMATALQLDDAALDALFLQAASL